jgi:hypothetical protein
VVDSTATDGPVVLKNLSKRRFEYQVSTLPFPAGLVLAG